MDNRRALLIAVGTTLAIELATQGVTLEAGHKAIHVAIGVWALFIVTNNWSSQYRLFAFSNGILWVCVAIVGWLLPDFQGLDAFNRLDTILHTGVAVTGLLSGLFPVVPLKKLGL